MVLKNSAVLTFFLLNLMGSLFYILRKVKLLNYIQEVRALEGLDVSHLIPYLNLPNTSNITIRGELIINVKTFNNKYKGQYKSPRNFIGGVVNSKTKDPGKWKVY